MTRCPGGRSTGLKACKGLSELWLFAAPGPVLGELEAIRPGVFVVHNDAPRSLRGIEELRKQLRHSESELEGIEIVSHGPTVDGYLAVGVMTDVAAAQARFDELFGSGAVQADQGEMGVAC
jgi:hypothetical protein